MTTDNLTNRNQAMVQAIVVVLHVYTTSCQSLVCRKRTKLIETLYTYIIDIDICIALGRSVRGYFYTRTAGFRNTFKDKQDPAFYRLHLKTQGGNTIKSHNPYKLDK